MFNHFVSVRKDNPCLEHKCQFQLFVAHFLFLPAFTFSLSHECFSSPDMPTICISWIFLIGDLRFRSIFWHPHYKSLGEKPNPSYKHQVRLFYHELNRVRLLLMHQVLILVSNIHRGHLGSPKVTNRFLLITYDLEIWVWSHSACLVTMHRLICDMTYLGQHVTSHDLDRRSNIDLTKVTM